LNPSSQIHPILIGFGGDRNVTLLSGLVLPSIASYPDDGSSDMLNQLSSASTGDSLNSNELFGDSLDSLNTSNPFRKGVSVVTNGRNVIGSRCCSSNVYRALAGEFVIRDRTLCGDEDDEENNIDGVVVCAGGVILPSFGLSPEDGRRVPFWPIKSVKRRVMDDFLDEEDGIDVPEDRGGDAKDNL